MKCSKCRKLLVEFQDCRLDGILATEVKAHIDNCRSCRHEADEFRYALESVIKLDKNTKMPKPSDDFLDCVMDRIRDRSVFAFYPNRLAIGMTLICWLIAFSLIFFYVRLSEQNSQITAPDVQLSGKNKIGLPKPKTANRLNIKSLDSNKLSDQKRIKKTQAKADLFSDANQIDMHESIELLRVLGQALEVMEGDKQEWEIEI